MSGQAVILAAGRGTRLGTLGERTPKVLLRVRGRTLLEHHLEALRGADINDVIVVLGRHGSMWTDENVSRIESMGVRTVFNDENTNTHSTWSIHLTEPLLREQHTLFIDGDTFYDEALIYDISSTPHATLVCSPVDTLQARGTKIIARKGVALGAGQEELESLLGDDATIGAYAGAMAVPAPDLTAWLDIVGASELKERILEFALKRFIQKADVRVTFNTTITNINTEEKLSELNL